MSKADVIEIEGVVVEKLPNGEQAYRTCNNQRKTPHELYQDSAGRQGYDGDVSI